MDDRLTLVTVVFDAETPLLEVQARSFARYLEQSAHHHIIVIDNCIGGLRARRRRRLLREYGPHADNVRFVRLRDLVDARGMDGWRAQQLGKILVAREVTTPHYVVLDAKNHAIRPWGVATFVGDDGRAHGAVHSYASHPLRQQLESTLRYFGQSPNDVRRVLLAFPPTAPPFVFDTELVRAMVTDIERTSGRVFADEFERARLLEFFLYSAWLGARGPGASVVLDGTPLPSPTVWPKAATVEGVAAAASEAAEAAIFGVHRRVLVRGGSDTRCAIAVLWADWGLASDRRAALRIVARLRRKYVPAMAATRLLEDWHRSRRRRRSVSVGAGSRRWLRSSARGVDRRASGGRRRG